jgi:hypothetical protein
MTDNVMILLFKYFMKQNCTLFCKAEGKYCLVTYDFSFAVCHILMQARIFNISVLLQA